MPQEINQNLKNRKENILKIYLLKTIALTIKNWVNCSDYSPPLILIQRQVTKKVPVPRTERTGLVEKYEKEELLFTLYVVSVKRKNKNRDRLFEFSFFFS